MYMIIKCDNLVVFFQDQSSGYHYVDVRQLHRLMVAEVNSLRGAGVTAQKQSLLEVEL